VRNQLWAEARDAFENGEEWHPDSAMAEQAREQQVSRREVDPWEEQIGAYLERQEACSGGTTITSDEIYAKCLGFESWHRVTRQDINRVGRIMGGLRYTRRRRRVDSRLRHVWVADD
jgi:predicted P-loop ATPase